MSATVHTTASSEPRPSGTSTTCVQAVNEWGNNRSGHFRRSIRLELDAIDPDSMEHDGDTTRQGDHGALAATALCELGSPCSQPCRSTAVHHDSRCLAQRPPQVDVARLRDPARDIAFTRLVARGRQSDPRANLLEEAKRAGSSTAERKVSATTASIPGIVIRRLQTGSSRARWRTFFSRTASS